MVPENERLFSHEYMDAICKVLEKLVDPNYQPKPRKPAKVMSEIKRCKMPEGITKAMMVNPK